MHIDCNETFYEDYDLLWRDGIHLSFLKRQSNFLQQTGYPSEVDFKLKDFITGAEMVMLIQLQLTGVNLNSCNKCFLAPSHHKSQKASHPKGMYGWSSWVSKGKSNSANVLIGKLVKYRVD